MYYKLSIRIYRSSFFPLTVTTEVTDYRTVENLGGVKLWQIWRFTTNLPKVLAADCW